MLNAYAYRFLDTDSENTVAAVFEKLAFLLAGRHKLSHKGALTANPLVRFGAETTISSLRKSDRVTNYLHKQFWYFRRRRLERRGPAGSIPSRLVVVRFIE